MSSIMKMFLLLAVMVCISEAQLHAQCLCPRVRSRISSMTDIREVQIYEATIFCDRMEIVVTNNSGLRYCLNPNLKAVQKLLTAMKPKTSTTARPTVHTSSTGSANIARM
ncbi:C-X-C motif chemokine 11-like isoform X5 [Epinephelus fuscoguttatus]|uniref:C-X-C motif chemokine 11-like isoform X5 n=1 Tax=Epinephelus fuscoguttatus TaxID=293821 RepID=UPI0020D0D8E3|nr:C-X-C motif chemokine 11-like isoform X5 [Epinephelus fuscoguttatus]